jgi:virginiamycin B lyase
MRASRVSWLAVMVVAACGGGGTTSSQPTADPVIQLSASMLAFSGQEGGVASAAQSLTVTNAGGGSLAPPTTAITYGHGSNWLTVTGSNGAAPYTLIVEPNVMGLAAGSYDATVTVTSAGASNSPCSFQVSLDVSTAPAVPVIQLSSTLIAFTGVAGGPDPESKSITVSNAGDGVLAPPTAQVTYGQGSGWLTVSSREADPYELVVRPSPGGLTEGHYAATVVVSCAGARESPGFQVILVVGSAPVSPIIQVSPAALWFAQPQGGPGSLKHLTVSNAGGGDLAAPVASIAYGKGEGWLGIAVMGSNPTYTLAVSVQAGALRTLEPGTYDATISLTCAGADNSPQVIPVILSVTDPLPGTIRPFDIPSVNALPTAITRGADGNLWFLESGTGYVAQITSAGVVTEHKVALGDPVDITSGPDGALWITASGDNEIVRLTTDGLYTRFRIPTPNAAPGGIAVGTDGNLWFTERSGNKIGRLTPAGTFTEFPVPTSNAHPERIVGLSNSQLWFTERDGNKIGVISTNGSIVEHPIPTANAQPEAIVDGPDGVVWFTEYNTNKIGRITFGGTVTEFDIPTPTSHPTGLTVGPDGALWFTEQTSFMIGRITTGGTVTEQYVPSSVSRQKGPFGIVSGRDGNIWFTDRDSSQIGRLLL